MLNNDVLRSLRYMLDLSEVQVIKIFLHVGKEVSPQDVATWLLKNEEEEGFVDCPRRQLSQFLDGLIIHKRGRRPDAPPPPPENTLDNNMILKKLRVAFELKEEDILQILNSVGFRISAPEINALFRKKGHPNYRDCGDQILRNFLKGLTARVRDY
ncbi:MAG: hypothetical protein RL095_393 [Verrucomicrobiota bacterium]|jgi:uncharacterized protein YehS (DUF1456 family)